MEPLHLLTLPRELRDIIYQYYLYEPHGYHFDYKRKKFRTSTGAQINVSLKFACKQTCAEIHVTDITLNVLHFSPISHENIPSKAQQFHELLQKIESAKDHAIKSLAFHKFAAYRTSSVKNVIDRKYPGLRNLFEFDYQKPGYDCYLEHYKFENGILDSLGEAPSLLRSYMDVVGHILSENPNFVRELAQWRPLRVDTSERDDHRPLWPRLSEYALYDQRVWALLYHSPRLLSIFYRGSQSSSALDPWSVPSEDDLITLSPFQVGRHNVPFKGQHEGRFSAAAAAITCFKALKQQERLAIRHIILHESHGAAAYPECHGLGLIQFCRENPLLKVSRHVNFWRTVISPGCWVFSGGQRAINDDGVPNESFHNWLESHVQARTPGQVEDWVEFEDISVPCMVRRFAGWIIEASRLSAAGMPDGSFTLIFDADHTSNQASKFFELLKLQLAWQQAWDYWTAARPTHCSFRMRRLHQTFLFEGLPQVVEEMIRGRSPIKCNFPIGELVDIAPFIDDIPEEEAWEHVRKWRRVHEY